MSEKIISFPAVSSRDYVAVEEGIIFAACEIQQCVAVTIVDDVVDEPDEVFHASLERTPGMDSRITLDPTEGKIEIRDNDGMNLDTLRLQYNVMVCCYYVSCTLVGSVGMNTYLLLMVDEVSYF